MNNDQIQKKYQEVFTKAYLGLKSQNFQKSFDKNWEDNGKLTACLYRGPNGLKCAIGHCIPDENYDHLMEGEINIVIKRGIKDCFFLDHKDFLYDLQQCHDESDGGESMKEHLEIFARLYNLTIPKET